MYTFPRDFGGGQDDESWGSSSFICHVKVGGFPGNELKISTPQAGEFRHKKSVFWLL